MSMATSQDDGSVDPGEFERIETRSARGNGGGTIDITIPKDQVEKHGIEPKDEIPLVVCSDGMVIDP
jgi:hypothetical protein